MSQEEDSAFVRSFVMVLLALVAFTVFVMVAASLVGDDVMERVSQSAKMEAEIHERIRPVGSVYSAENPPPSP